MHASTTRLLTTSAAFAGGLISGLLLAPRLTLGPLHQFRRLRQDALHRLDQALHQLDQSLAIVPDLDEAWGLDDDEVQRSLR